MNESVDVIIPAYNASKYIREAIVSVCRQRGNYISKIIVVNDGSTDSTLDVVANLKFEFKNYNIELIDQVNLGASAARNAGLKRANAKYVAFLDSDDIWDQSKIDKQINIFNTTELENVGLVYCDYRLITENGNKIENKGVHLDTKMRGNVSKGLTHGNKITGSASAVLIKLSILKDFEFDTTLVCAEDWDLWLNLSNVCNFDYVNESLVSIRVHPNNSQNNQYRMLDGELLFLNKLYQKHQLRWSYLIYFRRRLHWARLTGDQLSNNIKCDEGFKKLLVGWRLNYILLPEFFMKSTRLFLAVTLRTYNYILRFLNRVKLFIMRRLGLYE